MAHTAENHVYRVVIDGYILANASKQHVVKKLKRLFGATEEKVLRMLDGQPTIIKNNLPKSKAYQYLRTITNAGAACHIDKLTHADPEDTTQLPVHIERSSRLSKFDPLEKIKKSIQQKNDFSEVMRQEIIEMDQVRKKSDTIILTLFAILFFLLVAAGLYLFFF